MSRGPALRPDGAEGPGPSPRPWAAGLRRARAGELPKSGVMGTFWSPQTGAKTIKTNRPQATRWAVPQRNRLSYMGLPSTFRGGWGAGVGGMVGMKYQGVSKGQGKGWAGPGVLPQEQAWGEGATFHGLAGGW